MAFNIFIHCCLSSMPTLKVHYGIETLVHEALKAYLPQPPKLMHPSNSKRKFASYINHHM